MPNEPLVSIITVTHNHAPYVAACISSVLAQSYSNWEQIIIDDGSTDGTQNVVQSFSDPRVHFFAQENRGIGALSRTYNEALSRSKGEIIAILEGDDLWPSEKLTTLVRAFTDQQIVLAYGGVRECAPDGTLNSRLSRSARKRKNLSKSILFNMPVGAAVRYMLRADNMDLLPESTVLIRRSTLELIGGFRPDPDMSVASFPTFLALGLCGRFYFTPEVMGYRRRHASSASVKYFDQLMGEAERHVLRFIEQHAQELDLSNAEQRRITNSWRRSEYQRHFVAGRLLLTQKHWKEARRRFLRALHPLLPRTFVASVAGWILSGVHCDLERVLMFLGKTPLSVGDARKTS